MMALWALAALSLAAGATLALPRLLPHDDHSARDTLASQDAEYATEPPDPDTAGTAPLAAAGSAVADVPPPAEGEKAPQPEALLAEARASDPARQPTGALPAPGTSGPQFQPRWTRVWANVRQRPDNESPILGVLAPGTEIQGVRGRWGWWTIQLGVDSVGYIAGELLAPAPPPDSMPPRS